MLPFWETEGRSTARIACGSLGTSGGAIQTFVTTTELQNRSDDCTMDLASAKGHSVFESLIYRKIWVRRIQEGNCYVSVSSLCCLQDTQGNFWLNISVVQKAEPAQLTRICSTEFGHSKGRFPCWPPQKLHLSSSFQFWQAPTSNHSSSGQQSYSGRFYLLT